MSQLIPILTLQGLAGIILLAGTLLVIAGVILLIATSAKSDKESIGEYKVFKKRSHYFIGLSVVFVVIIFVSLQFLPYSRFQYDADEVVTVVKGWEKVAFDIGIKNREIEVMGAAFRW